MISISLCMIVKNEEKNLRTCVESLQGIYDELIIVDTGSDDATKKIAKELGATVFDFAWTESFSDARNFAFSKCSCDYIYSADADETMDAENRNRFLILKENMDEQVGIVQMWYRNQLAYDTVYNFDKELRPKLFKRLSPFVWEGAVHEQVRMSPVVFDSDIEIDHKPTGGHAARDLAHFRAAVTKGEQLSATQREMYARELCKAGTESDFSQAKDFFLAMAESPDCSMDEIKRSFYILARAARLEKDDFNFMKFALRDVACEPTSETCYELGLYYRDHGDTAEAAMWFYNAAYEGAPLLDIHRASDLPLGQLAECYKEMGDHEQAAKYLETAKNLKVGETLHHKENQTGS